MDFEENDKVDLRLQIPRLSKSNWNTEFKEAFKNLALNYGEAGDILITGRDPHFVQPVRDQQAFRQDADGNPMRNQRGELVMIDGQRRYPDGEAGQRAFEEDRKRWQRLRENKKRLISKLFLLMERDVRDKVVTSEGYERAYAAYDLLALWNITEQVVMGRGNVSVYALTARLLSLRQTGD